MKHVSRHLFSAFYRSLIRCIETNQGQLRRVPNHVLALTVFICASVLLQGIGDLVLKGLGYTALFPAIPWRIDFLFLTAVSVLMGYRTLTGMRQRKFDVTRNSIELGLLVEVGLIVGDITFIRAYGESIPSVFITRLPFIILTTLNVFILLYMYRVLNLRSWWRS